MIDLFYHTRGLCYGRDTEHCIYGCYDTDQLPGEFIFCICILSSVHPSRFQALDCFRAREHCLHVLKGKRPLIDHRLFPQTFAYLSLAAASLLIVLRVYVLVHISAVWSSLNLALIVAVSIAIWNKHRVAMGMAIGIWGINVVLHIQGESPSPIFDTDDIYNHTTAVW